MCRKPHQESGPTGKALVQAEVTRQDTQHNKVSPVPQPSGAFGHIMRPILQQGVQEMNTAQEARVIMVRKTGRAAQTPNLASRASFTTMAGDVPLKGTPPLPVRALDNYLARHTT